MTLDDKARLLRMGRHFSVGGTLIQARAVHKSLATKDCGSEDAKADPVRNAQVDWKVRP